jgi:preprotein translocase subunit SecF
MFKKNIDFLKLGKVVNIFAIFLSIISLVLVFSKGFNLGVDFAGGVVIEFSSNDSIDISKLRGNLNEKFDDFSVYNLSSSKEVALRMGVDNSVSQEEFLSEIQNIINKTYDNIQIRKVDYVGPQVGGELMLNGIMALVLGMIGIMAYLWFRFEWQYGLGAVIALLHDSIMTIGFFSITGLEFNLTSIAAILTIIGYSVNDSVIIYDRIRENIQKMRKNNIKEIVNKSINETLSRTTLTVLTTLIANLALILFGGNEIASFSIAMFFGIIVGTYSSIFISAPILVKFGLQRNKFE